MTEDELEVFIWKIFCPRATCGHETMIMDDVVVMRQEINKRCPICKQFGLDAIKDTAHA